MSLGETQSYMFGGEQLSTVLISNFSNNTLSLSPDNILPTSLNQFHSNDISNLPSNNMKKQNFRTDNTLNPSLSDYTYGARQEIPKSARDMENHLANMLIRGVLSFRELLRPALIASKIQEIETLSEITKPDEDLTLSKNQLRKIDSKKKQKEVRRLARRDCNHVVLDFIALCNLPQDAFDYAFSGAQGAEKVECDLIAQRIQDRKRELGEIFDDTTLINEKITLLGMINNQQTMNSYETLTKTESEIGDGDNIDDQPHLARFQKFVQSLILDDGEEHQYQSTKTVFIDPYHSFISILHPETGRIKSSEGEAMKKFNWDRVSIWADPLFTGGQLPRKALRKREQVRNVAFLLDKIVKERKCCPANTMNSKKYRVVDVGCASGNGSLALANFFPEIQFLLFDVHEESAKQCLARVCALHAEKHVQHSKRTSFSEHGMKNWPLPILCCGDLEKALTVEFAKESESVELRDIFGLTQALNEMRKNEMELTLENGLNFASQVALQPIITFLRSFLEHSENTTTKANVVHSEPETLLEYRDNDLKFAASNVAVHQGICPTELISIENDFDCVIATHACGVGTDYAVVQAIERHAVLITLPCCTGKIPKQLKEMRQRVLYTSKIVASRETEKQDFPCPLVGKRAKLSIAPSTSYTTAEQAACFDSLPVAQSSEPQFQTKFKDFAEASQSTKVFKLDSPGSSRISSQVNHPRSNKFRRANARYKAMVSMDNILGLNAFKKPKYPTHSNTSNGDEDMLSRIASFAESTADSATHDVSALQRLCKICLEYDRACQLVEQKYGVVIAKLQPDTASKKNDLLIGIPL